MSVAFSEAKLKEIAIIGLILAFNVKCHFRFGISALDSSPEPHFSQVGPEIKNFEISKDMVT